MWLNTYLLWTKFENVDQIHEMVLKKREIAFYNNTFIQCISYMHTCKSSGNVLEIKSSLNNPFRSSSIKFNLISD